MAKKEIQIKVGGMSCQHCVKSIEQAVAQLSGVDSVVVDLARGEVAIAYQPEKVTLDSIKNAIEGQGYNLE